jgi:lysophospholipase L1-like esterase
VSIELNSIFKPRGNCAPGARWITCALVLAAACASLQARADETAPTSYSAWQSTMDAFAAADLKRRPDSNGILFVGSSTIRLWRNLAEDFREQPVVINRGFGGSTLADCEHFARQLVLQYRPARVLIYAGDNDLAVGRSPAQVVETFARFTAAIRAELPQTRIAYISIKPSPSRAALLPAIRETNRLIANHLRQLDNADYIDTHSAMLTPEGQPRPELFLPDMLHMNASGYALWQSVIAPYLAASAAVPPARAQSATEPPR